MARPRSFDSQKVLRRIRDLFWRKGYDGTTLADIMATSGLNKGSLYAAFGDKRAMYRAALEDYDRCEVDGAVQLLRARGPGVSGLAAIEQLLSKVVSDRVGSSGRMGCFLCNASADQAPVDQLSEAVVRASMSRFADAFGEALAGTAPYDQNQQSRHARAELLMAIYVGMRVMARGGAPVSALEAIRDGAISDLMPGQ